MDPLIVSPMFLDDETNVVVVSVQMCNPLFLLQGRWHLLYNFFYFSDEAALDSNFK